MYVNGMYLENVRTQFIEAPCFNESEKKILSELKGLMNEHKEFQRTSIEYFDVSNATVEIFFITRRYNGTIVPTHSSYIEKARELLEKALAKEPMRIAGMLNAYSNFKKKNVYFYRQSIL